MRRASVLTAALSALLFAQTAWAGTIIYDNGATDGSNAYSNGIPGCCDRFLYDDFVVPDGQTWTITDIEWTHIWESGTELGTGVELYFLNDNGGTPGTTITGTTVTSYSEEATGNFYFDRAENFSSAVFDAVVLGAGTYWIQARILGPELVNNYWLTRANVTGSELWVNYSDWPFFGPGSEFPFFTSEADLNFQLTGSPVPEPATLLLLGSGLAVAARRRLRKRT